MESANTANTLQQVDLAIKTGIGLQNQSRLERVDLQNEIDRLRSNAPYVPMAGANAGEIDDLTDEVKALKSELAERKSQEAVLRAAILERDLAIVEWMHNNEAFKRLAHTYGKKVGASVEQIESDKDEHLIDVAEEDPRFAKTNVLARAKAKAKQG